MAKSSLLPDHQGSVKSGEDNKWYHEKLMLINEKDPYTILGGELMDDVDCWSAITYVYKHKILSFVHSKHMRADLQSYKSLDSYG